MVVSVLHTLSENVVVNQRHLETVVLSLFEGENILTNSRKDASLPNPHSGYPLELDVWIPRLQICFEFQDPYHYITTWDSQLTIEQVQQKDNIKQSSVLARGDTLFQVPCWWDGKKESLIASIKFQRPDVLPEVKVHSAHIPLNPVPKFFTAQNIPDVGELMLASFPLSYNFVTSENPWWLGEKYDGVRFCWNNWRGKLYSRAGNELCLPETFLGYDFPNAFVDGEIWFGRGCFAEARNVVEPNAVLPDWAFMRFIAFDKPLDTESEYEDRYSHLMGKINNEDPVIIMVARMECTEPKQVSAMMRAITKDKGEGIVLRKPNSLWESGRSSSLLKVKAVLLDKEAMVISSRENKGFVTLLTPEGLRFRAALSLDTKPKRGDIVTFSFDYLSSRALPALPVVERVRSDLTWKHLVGEKEEEKKEVQPLPSFSKPIRPMTSKLGSNMRKFFENIAQNREFDPLVPENWYSISYSPLRNYKGWGFILSQFGGSVVKALLKLFPEIGLDETKFDITQRNYWSKIENRRQVLDKFAAENAFDPLDASKWYTITKEQLQSSENISTTLRFYSTPYEMLQHLYPEVAFSEANFSYADNHWHDLENQRRYFDNFAKCMGFDSLVPENWYNVSKYEIVEKQGAGPLRFYDNSLTEALLCSYPDIGLDKSRFEKMPHEYWKDEINKRDFFDAFAKERGFDPLVSENWYQVTLRMLLSSKNGYSVMSSFSHSHIKALTQVYPNIGLDKNKFTFSSKNHWIEQKNRKNLLDEFAKENGFDPLVANNWYSITQDRIIASRHGGSIMRFYTNHIEALMDLYPDIGLDKCKFTKVPRNHWLELDNRKKFFERFAKTLGFDPLVPDNWYSMTKNKIRSVKGGQSVLVYYNSFVSALVQLFPNIGLDESKFTLYEKYKRNSNAIVKIVQ